MQYVAALSYGKDSLAMLEVIHRLGLPLDRIITVEEWATDNLRAVLLKTRRTVKGLALPARVLGELVSKNRAV